MNHADWEVLRDQIAFQIYIRECAQMQIPREEAKARWAAMPDRGSLNRRVELRYTAGFALMALEEMGCLAENCPRVLKFGRKGRGAGSVQ